MVQQQRQRLSKVLGRTDVLAMAFGTMVAEPVVLPASWVQEAGVLVRFSRLLRVQSCVYL